MTSRDALFESSIPALPLLARGKVRDIYAVDDEHLLIVTTDRLSAYDVIMPDPVPGKGEILTGISDFWFHKMADLVPNHLTDRQLGSVIDDRAALRSLARRAIIVKRLQPLPIEAVVRGYLIGSGWRDYQTSESVCGIALPSGLQQASKLPEPLFTPATKADLGEHDENIDFAAVSDLIGPQLAQQTRDIALKIYLRAAEFAAQRGIIVADTKFEFGLDGEGRLHLIDEVLTPDSSRFWPRERYQPGSSPPSFDKQFVRDYLDTLDWDRTAPGPALPQNIIEGTAKKYREVYQILTGPPR